MIPLQLHHTGTATTAADSRVLEEEGAKQDATKDDDDFDKRDKLHRLFIVGLDPRLPGRGAKRSASLYDRLARPKEKPARAPESSWTPALRHSSPAAVPASTPIPIPIPTWTWLRCQQAVSARPKCVQR